MAGGPASAATLADDPDLQSPRAVYDAACASCHGPDGRGAPPKQLGFDVPMPDFSDCNFATREPNPDWVAVAHEGGPVRAFSPLMPAFGDALTTAQLRQAMTHIRTFCEVDDWPRGEFNLPRPLVTTKAYPEDELVFETTVAAEGPGRVETALIYERRFGARNQFEISVPFAWREQSGPGADDDWQKGLGDIKLGLKRVLYHDLSQGTILSVSGEISLPSGDTEEGFGTDSAMIEPSLLYGQLLPHGFFLHGQFGLGIPTDGERTNDEAFLRFAAGRSIVPGQWGRVWTPMVELVGAREMVSGADAHWDLVPQFQVTLSRRQHVRLNTGLRVPVDDGGTDRDTEFMVYLLWDWFDGGLLEGWQ